MFAVLFVLNSCSQKRGNTSGFGCGKNANQVQQIYSYLWPARFFKQPLQAIISKFVSLLLEIPINAHLEKVFPALSQFCNQIPETLQWDVGDILNKHYHHFRHAACVICQFYIPVPRHQATGFLLAAGTCTRLQNEENVPYVCRGLRSTPWIPYKTSSH